MLNGQLWDEAVCIFTPARNLKHWIEMLEREATELERISSHFPEQYRPVEAIAELRELAATIERTIETAKKLIYGETTLEELYQKIEG